MNIHNNNIKKNKEQGYVLIAAIGILMGLLAIVTSLVRISRQSGGDFDYNLKATQARFAMESAKNYQQAISYIQHPDDMSQLQRQWVLPGTRSIPYKLVLQSDVTVGATSIVVMDLKPLFMAMATCRDSSNNKIILNAALDYSSPPSTSLSLSSTAGIKTANTYFIIENELVSGSTGSPTRGIAGVQKAHPIGSTVYAMPNDFNGYLRINNEWIKVSNDGINFTSNTVSIAQRGIHNTNTATAVGGQTIYYYPFDPMLGMNGTIGNIKIDLINEQSRISLNGLTQSGILKILGTGLDNKLPLRSFGESIYQANNNSFTDNIILRESSLTLFSEPDPCKKETMYTNGPTFTDPQLKFSTGENTKVHAVNVNEASENTLYHMFIMMGIIPAEADALAIAIRNYRSGETGFPYNYFDGDENPFDGKDTRSTPFQYSSAAEEFRAMLPNNQDLIMKHVFGESHDLKNLTNVGPLICFEAGDVWRIQTAVTIGDKFAPHITKKDEIVVKNTPEPISTAGVTGTGTITLNSTLGWNEKNSTFFGVTARQPQINTAGVAIPGNVIFNFNETSVTSGYSQVCRSMIGNIGLTPLYITTKYGDGTNTDYLASTLSTNAVDSNEKKVDFGIRVLTNASPIQDLTLTYPYPLTAGNTNLYINEIVSNAWINQYLVLSGGDSTNYFFAKITSVSAGNLELSGIKASPGNSGYLDASSTWAAGSSTLKILGNYNTVYYQPNSTTAGANITAAGFPSPFYETVLSKEGATFTSISWTDSSSYGIMSDLGVSAPPVRCEINGTPTTNNTTGLTYSNYVRLRFYFDDGTSTIAAPQLFQVKVDYTTTANSPKRIVYARK
jgi:hypothetical protein